MLLKITKNSKGKISIEEWTQMKVGGNGIVEKKKSKRGVENNKKKRLVEYLDVGYKVIVALIINIGMCKREGV